MDNLFPRRAHGKHGELNLFPSTDTQPPLREPHSGLRRA